MSGAIERREVDAANIRPKQEVDNTRTPELDTDNRTDQAGASPEADGLSLDTDGKNEVKAEDGHYELSGTVSKKTKFKEGDILVCERIDGEEWTDTLVLDADGNFDFDLPPGEYEFYVDIRDRGTEYVGDILTVKGNNPPPKGPQFKANPETVEEPFELGEVNSNCPELCIPGETYSVSFAYTGDITSIDYYCEHTPSFDEPSGNISNVSYEDGTCTFEYTTVYAADVSEDCIFEINGETHTIITNDVGYQ